MNYGGKKEWLPQKYVFVLSLRSPRAWVSRMCSANSHKIHISAGALLTAGQLILAEGALLTAGQLILAEGALLTAGQLILAEGALLSAG